MEGIKNFFISLWTFLGWTIEMASLKCSIYLPNDYESLLIILTILIGTAGTIAFIILIIKPIKELISKIINLFK